MGVKGLIDALLIYFIIPFFLVHLPISQSYNSIYSINNFSSL